jgi:hypothetical protein
MVLALFKKGRRVSLKEAWRFLLVADVVRSYET